MTERPILFSAPMVLAILNGRKTQTRRVVCSPNSYFGSASNEFWKHADLKSAFADEGYLHVPSHTRDESTWGSCARCTKMGWEGTAHRLYPQWKVYGRLWVKETWQAYEATPHIGSGSSPIDRIPMRLYANTPTNGESIIEYAADGRGGRWRPSIFMPRWASRITLEITEVRVERLKDISEADAEAEGIESDGCCGLRIWSFSLLWNVINQKREFGWDENPWVWAISFRKIPEA